VSNGNIMGLSENKIKNILDNFEEGDYFYFQFVPDKYYPRDHLKQLLDTSLTLRMTKQCTAHSAILSADGIGGQEFIVMPGLWFRVIDFANDMAGMLVQVAVVERAICKICDEETHFLKGDENPTCDHYHVIM